MSSVFYRSAYFRMVLLTAFIIVTSFPSSWRMDSIVEIGHRLILDTASESSLTVYNDTYSSNYIKKQNLIRTNKQNISLSDFVTGLISQTHSSSIVDFYPYDETGFFGIFQELSLSFEILNNSHSTWKPKFIFNWPTIVDANLKNASKCRTLVEDLLLSNVKNIGFPINSEVFIVLHGNDRSTCLLEVYKSQLKVVTSFPSKDDFNFDKLGPLIGIRNRPLSTSRHDLSGIEIAAVAQNDPDYQPRIQITTHPSGSVEFTGGMCFNVLLELQFILGFRYKALDGEGWVGLSPNGTWTGMSGQVVNGKADIAIAQASTIMMTDQLHGISFLHPTSYGRLVAIFRQPPANKNIMTQAFEPYVWACGLITWVLVVLTVKFIFKISVHHGTMTMTGIERDEGFIHESFWWAMSTTCFLGWYMTPISRPLRITFLSGFLLALVTYVAYSASLVSLLSTETFPIKNFMDLSLSKINVFADKWLPMARYVVQELYQRRKELGKVTDDYFIQLELALPQILKKRWAFVTFSDAISVVFHRLGYSDAYFCKEVYSVGVSTETFSNAMFVKKGSPLKDILNTKIAAMIERGFVSRHNRHYDAQTQILCNNIDLHYRGGLTMTNLSTPFLVLAFGCILSFVFCMMEKLQNLITFRSTTCI